MTDSSTKNPQVYIDVTFTSLYEDDPDSIFFSPLPPLSERIEAVKELTGIGKYVRARIDPIVPSVNEIRGQGREELWELIRILKVAGVKMVISKTMRINQDLLPYVYENLLEYYESNGYHEGINLVLSPSVRRELLTPIFEACEHYKVPFCPCVELCVFPQEKICQCLCGVEWATLVTDVVQNMPEK